MSTPFYDLASLVVVPSGYKASKVYAQKPLTTDGQLAFTRSTTATRVNSAGLIEASAVNVPRLDYLNSSCPRLLLEPQRTNLLTYSEQIDNAAWTKEGITITANATTSPDGYTNADKLVASAAAGDKFAAEVLNVSNGVAYTTSAYFKAAEYTYAFMRLGGTSGNPYVIYNLATQAVVATSGLTTSTITSVGNGWYRVTGTATQTSTTLAPVLMVIPSTGYTLGGDNIVEFTGNGTSGGFIWGCQVEEGAYATSYIPTLGASVTRGADAATKTSISSLIGQTEGTMFFDLPAQNFRPADYQTLFLIYNNAGLANKYFHFYKTTGGTVLTLEVFNTTPQCGLVFTLVQNTRYKVAAVYKNNRFELWVNGTLASSDTSGTVATNVYDTMELSNDSFNTGSQLICGQVILFKTALTTAQLAELTTI